MTDISHLGIAVDDLEKATELFSLILGYGPQETGEVADQKVKVAMFASSDDDSSGKIELLQGTDEQSPIAKYVEKKGPGLHHLALHVDDIDAKLKELKANGIRLIDESPRLGAEGKRIAFIHPSSTGGVLLELQER